MLVPYNADDPPMEPVDTIGGAVTIVNCIFGDVSLNDGEEFMLEVMVECDAADPVDVTALWEGDGGNTVSADFELQPGSQTIAATIPYWVAAETWGRGATQIFLVIELADNEAPPHNFHGGANSPAPCGVINVV